MSSLSCLARAAPRIARASAHRPPPAPSAGAWRPRGFASFHQPSPRTSPFANLPPRTKAILLASGIALLGFDAYHFLYVHEPPPILDPERYVRFELAEKDKVAPDTWRLVFKHIPKPELTASQGQRSAVSAEWPIVSHLSVKNSEMQIQRPYTPTAVGPDTFEIIVKRYSDGFMTPWLVARKPGEKVEIRGPLPSFAYRPNAFKEIGMIAGGTGIAPMYQLSRSILSNPFDKTSISLVYGSKSPSDIILKKELDDLQREHGDRFKVYYAVDEASDAEWKGDRGFLDRAKIEGRLPNGEEAMVFVCGPDPMLESISGPLARDGSQGQLSGLLASLGYSDKQVWKFGSN